MNTRNIISNIWKLSCFAPYQYFLKNQNNLSNVQKENLKKILNLAENTKFGKKHSIRSHWEIEEFQKRIPISEYNDYEEFLDSILEGEPDVLTQSKIKRMGLSSGSSGKNKFIPFTEKLSKEYSNAISIWIYGLFQKFPETKNGQFYFSVSPSGFPERKDKKITVGFDKDGDYLKPLERLFAKSLLIVPEWLSQIPDTNYVMYVTCLRLLAAKNISFISIWHPSFFISILERIKKDKNKLIEDLEKGTISEPLKTNWEKRISSLTIKDPKRGNELKKFLLSDPPWENIWPSLKRISLWTDSFAESSSLQLKKILPHISYESKSVFATEGAITVPFYTDSQTPKNLLAYTSHFFEFMDSKGSIHLPEELQVGMEYEVVMTTGGGFYRYRLGDRFQVISHMGQVPELRFLGRKDDISDLVGEKLNEHFLQNEMKKIFSDFSFLEGHCFLRGNLTEKVAFYELVTLIPINTSDIDILTPLLESILNKNPHYAYARRLGQLNPVKITEDLNTQSKIGRVSTNKQKFLRTPKRI
ncbi:hypothetical protein EHR01_03985 [Leptospira mtsangambouensis]|uniref:GH3 middle domain-containing protein n=1 Tax=Leptospira mtsangambouensis TaxID=2484912 RepID=A0ABY2P3C7_9LEPT|nr:GH3 auxin-responsive promoter family protein [Leptospira mtsangambouensis]TGM81956.1 hypothetical protein EHR01_03985 [Leptospira mtsangambouensis]